jgi:signal transduction histidine kinase
MASPLGPAARDAVIAAATAATVFAAALWDPAQALARTSPSVLAALSLAVAAPLLFRRRAPMPVAIVTAAVALIGVSAPGWSGRLVALAALCSAAYHRPRRTGLLLAVSVATYVPYALLTRLPPDADAAVTQVVIYCVAPVAVGHVLRLHRDRAEQVARTHRAEAQREMADERIRIARDVHDAVGHHLTAIRMQANAARHVLEDTPIASRALETIAASAATALGEVRSLLAVLRDTPGAGLADVDALATALSTPRCPITVRRAGSAEPLPEPADWAGYRLVQEALTNAVRHAGAGRIDVLIHQDPREVVITVADDGPTHPPADLPAEGHGIRGMRERARLAGGTLEIAPRRPHGWEVRAVLPAGEVVR